jgi:hypothetical protein
MHLDGLIHTVPKEFRTVKTPDRGGTTSLTQRDLLLCVLSGGGCVYGVGYLLPVGSVVLFGTLGGLFLARNRKSGKALGQSTMEARVAAQARMALCSCSCFPVSNFASIFLCVCSCFSISWCFWCVSLVGKQEIASWYVHTDTRHTHTGTNN